MRRIFELAKVSKNQLDGVQHLISRREVSLTSQVCQASRFGRGSSNDIEGDKEGGFKKRFASRKGARSPFSSSRSSSKARTTSPLSASSSSRSRGKSKSRLTRNRGGLSTETMEGSSVRQDKAANKFTLDLGNNKQAFIDYKQIGKNKLELYHSEVPSELRGRGIGKALAKGAFQLAANGNTKLRLTCSYLAACMDKTSDPKLKKLVDK